MSVNYHYDSNKRTQLPQETQEVCYIQSLNLFIHQYSKTSLKDRPEFKHTTQANFPVY